MIQGISGVSYMTGVLSVQPYQGAQQYRGYAQAKASSRNAAGQNGMPISGVHGNQGAGALGGANSGTDAAAVSTVGSSQGIGAASAVQPVQRVAPVWSGRAANTGMPVEPVEPVEAVTPDITQGIAYAIPFLRKGMDPAELSVRMRMQYIDPSQEEKGKSHMANMGNADKAPAGVQEVTGKKECQTCKERKYQDGSDDPGVSYQTPTHISPEQAAAAVRGHEMEHVVREQASAEREDRRVVSQSVTMHTAICPECGRVYVSGGTTRTTTASDSQPEQQVSGQEAEAA